MSDLIAKMTASVLVIEQARCLVLEEMDDDGTKRFNLPGGHIEFGETPQIAAIREAKEETGYDIQIGDVLVIQVLTWETHSTAKYIFYGQRTGGVLRTEEGTILHWMNKKEIEEIPKNRWIRQMDEVLLLGLEGCKIDTRAAMFYSGGKRIK